MIDVPHAGSPLPVDQVALPDFNAGAMENWGLVTYRETALLYDPLVSSIWIKKRITSIIAHELAHMVSDVVFRQGSDSSSPVRLEMTYCNLGII